MDYTRRQVPSPLASRARCGLGSQLSGPCYFPLGLGEESCFYWECGCSPGKGIRFAPMQLARF